MPDTLGPAHVQVPQGPRRGRFAAFWRRLRTGDTLFRLTCQAAALSVPALATLLVLFLIIQSLPALSAFGLEFFVLNDWDPVRDRYGAAAFIFGTVATSAIAMLIAVPLSIGAAAFLAEIAPRWVRRGGSFLLELLAAIPSVVYGFWGIVVLAPVVQQFFYLVGGVLGVHVPNTGGTGILSAGLILAIMIVPYITAISYDVCRAVPRSQREASLALGATRWQTIRRVVLPYARPGIVGGCFLALGRALGETMAVTMLIGNNAIIDFSLFATGDSIASKIANQLGNERHDMTRSALMQLGLVLLLVTVVVNSLARLLIWRVGQVGKRAAAGAGRRRALPAPPAGAAPVPPLTLSELPLGRPQAVARWADRFMTGVLGSCLFITVGFLFLILGYLAYRGSSALSWEFFTNLPVDTPPGLGNALVGSLMLVGLATAWAVPVGIAAAIYLAEYRTSRLVPVVRFVGELLGGVPSIILGMFAWGLLVVPFDFSAWAGAFALGVMMIPIVMRASEEALKLVPQTIRHASYALGASSWQTIVRVVVPASLPAIITGVFLAIARIAGETAPLLMTAYNTNYWPTSPNDRTPYLTYYIFTYARYDQPAEQQLAWSAAVVLLAFIIVLNVGIRLLTGKRVVLASQAD
jgi:phosphate transport system permease protein